MAADLNDEERLVWDPICPTLEAYAREFDYDLLGQKVRRSERFFEDPQSHIERWMRERQVEIITTVASVILSLIALLFFKVIIINFITGTIGSLRYFLTLRSICSKHKKMASLPSDVNADADDFAADAYCRIMAASRLYSYPEKTDMTEYEAGRFTWEVIHETGLTFEEPRRKDQLEKMEARGKHVRFTSGEK
uniref:Integral membrane protein n=1 Tax=Mesocestoides corti TaxID=53468 RepID=A0A5K3G0F4_MESCO